MKKLFWLAHIVKDIVGDIVDVKLVAGGRSENNRCVNYEIQIFQFKNI